MGSTVKSCRVTKSPTRRTRSSCLPPYSSLSTSAFPTTAMVMNSLVRSEMKTQAQQSKAYLLSYVSDFTERYIWSYQNLLPVCQVSAANLKLRLIHSKYLNMAAIRKSGKLSIKHSLKPYYKICCDSSVYFSIHVYQKQDVKINLNYL